MTWKLFEAYLGLTVMSIAVFGFLALLIWNEINTECIQWFGVCV
jgi:hypothetical protein